MLLRVVFLCMLLLAYILPLAFLTYVNIRARYSKKYADKLGFRTVGDVRQFTFLSIIPFINLGMAAVFISDLIKLRTKDATPLHKEEK